MILQLKTLLRLKQYPLPLKKSLALPVREGGTAALKGWIGRAEGGGLGPNVLGFGF